MNVLICASGKGEWVEGITHIEVSLDAGLLAHVEKLRQAMLSVDANYISEFYHVDSFNGSEQVRSDCIMLVVGRDGFHFEGNFNDSSDEWYTPEISLDGKRYEAWEEDLMARED